MGYILNEEQLALRDTVRNFMEKEVKPHVPEIDLSGRFPTEIYEQMFEMGLHSTNIPEEWGGSGLDLVTTLMIYEEISRVDAGIADTIGSVELPWSAVLNFGDETQCKIFSDALAGGGYASFALTEPQAGSDAAAIRTTAVKDGDEYVINGSKCFITNGGVSDVYLVFAKTDKEAGTKGISAFVVEKSTPGISVGKEEDKMGIRASNTAEVVFDNVRVPAANLMGEEGKGFKYAMQALDKGRLVVSAMAIGIAQRAMEEAIEYAKTRVTFGQPIANFQGISFMIADMDIKIEAARQLMVHAAKIAESGKRYSREAAIAKCYASDMAVQVCLDAIQVLGGFGYSREYPVEKLLRDAKITQIFEGTNQVQRVVIGGAALK